MEEYFPNQWLTLPVLIHQRSLSKEKIQGLGARYKRYYPNILSKTYVQFRAQNLALEYK